MTTKTIAPKPKPKMPTYEEFYNQVSAEIIKQHNKYDPKALIDNIVSDFEKQKIKVLADLCGFNSRWGEGWEVDHCNGRAGNSPIGESIKQECRDFLTEWVKTNLDKVAVQEELMKTLNKAVQKEINDNLFGYNSQLNKFIAKEVEAIVKTTLDELRGNIQERIRKEMSGG